MKKAKKEKSFQYRSKPENEPLEYRTIEFRAKADGSPRSLDEETRSVEVVAATENPSPVFDPERFEIVDEVMLMSGASFPRGKQIPLFDTHPWRFKEPTTVDILGSARNLRVEGNQVIGRAYFSSVPVAEDTWTKVKEGHVTDVSLGYRILKSQWIPEGEQAEIQGKIYKGPLKVALKWRARELSITPIGADEYTKARSEKINHSNKSKEEEKMDEKLRKFLQSRGLPKEATEAEAWAFLENLDIRKEQTEIRKEPDDKTQAKDPENKENEIRIEAARQEQARCLEIRSMSQQFEYPDEEAEKLITENKTVEEARKIVMNHILESKKQTRDGVGHRQPVELIYDERDKFRAAASDAIVLRAGVEGLKIEKPAEGALELRGFSLVEIGRHCLRIVNEPYGGDVMDMIGRALTSSDFPYILADSANKALFTGFNTAAETWRTWIAIGSVSDFKTHKSVRAGEFDDLDQITEENEYKYGKRDEAQEQYSIATYGKLFAISRVTIVNDDLNALSDVPRGHGEAAARKIGDVVYAVLTANSNMGDGNPLFHSSHNNLAGTAGAPDVDTIAAGELAMGTQKDIGGKRRLNISPVYLIGPKALKAITEKFFVSEYIGTQALPNQRNIYNNFVERVYDARLDDASSTAWYLAGAKGKTITVFFLNGVQDPYMETKNGWSRDGVEYKVRIDCGAKAMDWRALYKNAGA